MDEGGILEESIQLPIFNYDSEAAAKVANEAVEAKIDYRKALDALTEALRSLGGRCY